MLCSLIEIQSHLARAGHPKVMEDLWLFYSSATATDGSFIYILRKLDFIHLQKRS